MLTAPIYRTAAGTLGDLTYQYDAAGNRSRVGGSLARSLLPTAVASPSYDAANRQRAFGSSPMTFDANGNLSTLTDGPQTTTFTWDARDRLIGLEQPGTLGSFAYAFGRRLAKTVNDATTQFLYDGLDVAQQLEAQRTTSYLRSLAIDETLGLTNPDGSFFLTADALGSTVAVSDSAGSAVTEYTYDTFGLVSASNPAFPNPFQFTGRENDALAGLSTITGRGTTVPDSSGLSPRIRSESPTVRPPMRTRLSIRCVIAIHLGCSGKRWGLCCEDTDTIHMQNGLPKDSVQVIRIDDNRWTSRHVASLSSVRHHGTRSLIPADRFCFQVSPSRCRS